MVLDYLKRIKRTDVIQYSFGTLKKGQLNQNNSSNDDSSEYGQKSEVESDSNHYIKAKPKNSSYSAFKTNYKKSVCQKRLRKVILSHFPKADKSDL